MSGNWRANEAAVRRALARAGYLADRPPPRPEFRRWRWLARLPEGRIAFFADDPEAVERLGRERALLDLLHRRVSSFAVPAVEHARPTAGSRFGAWSRASTPPHGSGGTSASACSTRPRRVGGWPASWAAPSPSCMAA